MKAQISAAERGGAIGWMLWNASVVYNWGVFGAAAGRLSFPCSSCETACVAAMTQH